jgi:hypothetical protein
MAYKATFRPLERLGRDGWRRMDDDQTVTNGEVALPGRRHRKLLIEA